MAASAEDTMETAALGRPFRLGMLYDCRKDALIPGVTLWDHEQLKNNTDENKQQNSEFNITTSDSIDEKCKSLEVSGSLTLSVIGGLVNVTGSARYLKDTKKSHKQERLTLKYKTTANFETLTMSHLGRGKVSHPNVFEDDTATHVVTAILYGASAYFIFDRELSKDEDKKQVEGEAKIVMDKLKVLTGGPVASFNMDEREKSAVEKFSCTFHGDFQLPSNPSSFSEAVDVYRKLPTLLGDNGEHAVPVRVWLYPLMKLDSKAARLQREISNSLITYTSGIIEHLNKTEMRCNDLLKDTAAATFPVMEEKLCTFIKNCHHYKLEFVQKLGSVLPSIRGGGEEETVLVDILKEHEKSPFNSKDLDQWLRQKEKESDTVQSLLKQLEKLGTKLDDNLDDLLSDVCIKNIVSFTFTSIDQPDNFLVRLSDLLKPTGMFGEYTVLSDIQKVNTEWCSPNTRHSLRRQLQLFEQLRKLTNNEDTKFTVTSKYDESYPGACILIYEDGCEPVIFIPPSKPATPTTSDASYSTLTVCAPDPDSATIEYRVEFKRKQETEWTSHSVQKEQENVTLSGLKPDTEYEIRTTAVGKLGYSVSSDVVTALTKVMGPPTAVKVTQVTANTITLTWRYPCGKDYQSLAIEYRMKLKTEWISHTMQKNQTTVTLSELNPDTGYEIRATAVGRLGNVVNSIAVTYKTTMSPHGATAKTTMSPPTSVQISQVKANSITLTWSIPEDCEDLKQYIIEFKEENSSDWQKEQTTKETYSCTLENLKQNTAYSIRMRTDAVCGMSNPGEEIKTKTKKDSPDKSRFTHYLSGNPPVYMLNLTDTGAQLKKKVFGDALTRFHLNRTIMFVGATGSGKTTLINGMINYVLGVEWEDNWRFKLIDEETNKSQAHSQTSEVTAYQIHQTDEFKIPYSLTIIDTPGFGDTRGIKQDKEITEKIRQFFTNKDGIDEIDSVCFVVQAALARLTHTQRYIFEAILSVFGKDIADNIITLVTFADGKSPPVLEAIKEANIPCATHKDGYAVHFKFNNCVLFANNTRGSNDEIDFDSMFWKMGQSSMSEFFTHLDKMQTQSLTLTKQVLQERKHLGTNIQGVQALIRKGLSTMEEIRTTQAVLDKHKTKIEENKDFDYEVEVEKVEMIEIPTGNFVTNCYTCNYTCHFPCAYADDKDKINCSAMCGGKCTVCPGKCVWSVHYNMKYRWEMKREKEKRTYQELKNKFETALGEKMSTEKILAQLQVEYNDVKEEVAQMMDTVTKYLQRLNEIALRPDPLSTPDYIDLLIESEKQEAKHGYKERIQELQEVREHAVLMQKVKQGKAVLPEHESIVQENKKESKVVFSNIVNWFKKPKKPIILKE